MLFDRSWYNRAGVERVMGFCTQKEYLEFMRQAPEFERMLVHNNTHLVKYWFSVSRAQQRRRFKERQVHPLKQWNCLLYTSDAADERSSVDLGGRRIIKKKTNTSQREMSMSSST